MYVYTFTGCDLGSVLRALRCRASANWLFSLIFTYFWPWGFWIVSFNGFIMFQIWPCESNNQKCFHLISSSGLSIGAQNSSPLCTGGDISSERGKGGNTRFSEVDPTGPLLQKVTSLSWLLVTCACVPVISRVPVGPHQVVFDLSMVRVGCIWIFSYTYVYI